MKETVGIDGFGGLPRIAWSSNAKGRVLGHQDFVDSVQLHSFALALDLLSLIRLRQ